MSEVGESPALPYALVDTAIEPEFGFRVEPDRVACAGLLRKLGVRDAQMGDVGLRVMTQRAVEILGHNEEDTEYTYGQTDDLEAQVNFGTLMEKVEVLVERGQSPRFIELWLECTASSIAAHEFRHVADKIVIGDEAIEAEDKRYEQKKLVPVKIERAATVTAGLASAFVVGAFMFLYELPLWAKLVGGVGVGVGAIMACFSMLKDFSQNRLPDRLNYVRTSIEGYWGRPEEIRARQVEQEHWDALMKGEAEPLVRVTRV